MEMENVGNTYELDTFYEEWIQSATFFKKFNKFQTFRLVHPICSIHLECMEMENVGNTYT